MIHSNNAENPLSKLQPQVVWNYFHQLNIIPRPSHHEEKIQQYMLDFGESLGLETSIDEVGNVIIKKPATKGMEDRKGVILQSHLDMVPQANNDTEHNFATDPIRTYIDRTDEGNWVTAKGTTLGADNGMGVAAIMAILASDSSDNTGHIEHGAIEALFTSTEETGMVGAFGLKAGLLEGDILLNLDSEDEGELYVGCAGGVDATSDIQIERVGNNQEQTDGQVDCYKVVLKSLRGGHSGLNVIDQGANANKLLVRWLNDVNFDLSTEDGEELVVRLISLSGGNLRNAIPREGEVIIKTKQLIEVTAHLQAYLTILQAEYKGIERNISLTIESISNDLSYLTTESQNKVVNVINATPNGIYRMSNDMEGLVETSCNLGIINTTERSIEVSILLRSSLDTAKKQLANEIKSVYSLIGVETIFTGNYPGWEPNPQSEILSVMKTTGEQVFGHSPELKGIHAGLECGILGINYPHWDMISFGPTIRGAHSPDERVHIDSVVTFYAWLLATLKQIPKESNVLMA